MKTIERWTEEDERIFQAASKRRQKVMEDRTLALRVAVEASGMTVALVAAGVRFFYEGPIPPIPPAGNPPTHAEAVAIIADALASNANAVVEALRPYMRTVEERSDDAS